MPLSEDEMRALLFRLFETELPPHDVHGRSTIVQLPRRSWSAGLVGASRPGPGGPDGDREDGGGAGAWRPICRSR